MATIIKLSSYHKEIALQKALLRSNNSRSHQLTDSSLSLKNCELKPKEIDIIGEMGEVALQIYFGIWNEGWLNPERILEPDCYFAGMGHEAKTTIHFNGVLFLRNGAFKKLKDDGTGIDLLWKIYYDRLSSYCVIRGWTTRKEFLQKYIMQDLGNKGRPVPVIPQSLLKFPAEFWIKYKNKILIDSPSNHELHSK